MNPPWEPRWRQGPCQAVPALVLGAVSAATSAVGAIGSGIAQQHAANFQAAVDHNNAVQAQDAASVQAEASQDQTRSRLAQQRSAYAASGVDVGSGSPLDVMSDATIKGKLDAMTLRYGGGITGQRDVEAGQLATAQGDAALTAGALGAGTTLLSSAGDLSRYASGKGSG